TTASADGKLCAASGGDNLIRLIDCAKVQEKGTLPLLPFKPGGVTINASMLALSADGRFLAARCSDGNLRSWDVQQAKEIRQLPTMGFNGPIVFAPDGRSLLTADVQLRLWEQASGRERWRFNLTRVGGATSLAFAQDGQ